MFDKIFNIKIFNNTQYIKKQNIFNKFKKYIVYNGYIWYPLTLEFSLATGITDDTTLRALNEAEGGLISLGLINKIKAWYPMIGGTSTTHKYNFMDAQDLDASYRLTFNGGWTHSSTGALPNGVNAYAHTHYTESLADQNNISLSYYSRIDSPAVEVDFGSYNGSAYTVLEINTGGTTYGFVNSSTNFSFADPNSLGMYTVTRKGATDSKLFKNGVEKNNSNLASLTPPNQPIYLGAFNNNGSPAVYSTKECATAIIAEGLTDSEAINLHSIINTLQTSLGRNVY